MKTFIQINQSKGSTSLFKLQKLLGLLLICLFFNSCSEINQISEPKGNNVRIEPRLSTTEITWLTNFQDYLYDLRANTQRTNIYSLAEAVYGVEALINIRYANSKIGKSKFLFTDTFAIQTNSDWFALFENAHDQLVSDLGTITDTNIVLAAYDIQIDTIVGSNIRIITKCIFKDKSPSAISQYYSSAPSECDEPFQATEAYFLWLGGIESLTWWWPSLDCETECGLTEPGVTGAMEEIQHHINASYPTPTCGPGYYWTGKFTDIKDGLSHINWSDGRFTGCEISAETEYVPCDCLRQDELNCIYCTIYAEIGISTYPITIPSGYDFISIELGVDMAGGTPLETTATRIDIVWYHGKKVCAEIVPWFVGDILTMQLDVLECC